MWGQPLRGFPADAGFCLRDNRGNRCCRGQLGRNKTSFCFPISGLSLTPNPLSQGRGGSAPRFARLCGAPLHGSPHPSGFGRLRRRFFVGGTPGEGSPDENSPPDCFRSHTRGFVCKHEQSHVFDCEVRAATKPAYATSCAHYDKKQDDGSAVLLRGFRPLRRATRGRCPRDPCKPFKKGLILNSPFLSPGLINI